jgi:hypothetical protein
MAIPTLGFLDHRHAVWNRDTLRATVTFPSFDSLERPVMKTDTLRLTYRPPARSTAAAKKSFVLSSPLERSRSVSYDQPVILNTTLPFARIDTSRITLSIGQTPWPGRLTLCWQRTPLKGWHSII